ncbi:type II secretion system F family protein [Halostagnicola bangensis]
MRFEGTPAVGKRAVSLTTLETKLERAGIAEAAEGYLARAGVVGFVVGFISLLLGVGLGSTLVETSTALGASVAVAGTGLLFGTAGAILGFGSIIVRPYARATARKREINMLLPDAVSFMYALSVGGLGHLELLEAVADAEDAYGEVAVEFQRVLRDVEYVGSDYRSAIRTQAHETPSDELSQFLLDLLSTINSGGDMERFLEEKSERHAQTAKQQQERTLDTLELVGELYMTLSLFPLLLVIVVVVMQLLPNAAVTGQLLYLTVYGLLPAIGIAFLVLISTIKRDECGDGVLEFARSYRQSETTPKEGLSDSDPAERFVGRYRIFTRITHRERAYKRWTLLAEPHAFFRERPLATLAVTIPASLLVVGGATVIGISGLPWGGSAADPIRATVVCLYVPLYLVLTPLAAFYEWNVSQRTAVLDTFSEDLRKLSSTNDTGQPLLASLRSVSQTADGRLATEFEAMHTKVAYGRRLDQALVEFANSYQLPRLARTTRLITEAQKATNHITPVLRTAATASENHDELERERRSRTRMQVAIIVMTFLTVLAVIAVLQTQFVETMSGLGTETATGSGGASGQLTNVDSSSRIDAGTLSALFFHAVTFQAILSGFICGYLRNADLLSGAKYVIALSTIALVGWAVVI